MRVSATPPLHVQIDGETLGETPFVAEVVPSGARLVVPLQYAVEKGFSKASGREVESEPVKKVSVYLRLSKLVEVERYAYSAALNSLAKSTRKVRHHTSTRSYCERSTSSEIS